MPSNIFIEIYYVAGTTLVIMGRMVIMGYLYKDK